MLAPPQPPKPVYNEQAFQQVASSQAAPKPVLTNKPAPVYTTEKQPVLNLQPVEQVKISTGNTRRADQQPAGDDCVCVPVAQCPTAPSFFRGNKDYSGTLTLKRLN